MKREDLTKAIFTALIFSVVFFSACSDSDDDPAPNKHEDAFGDVFVKKVKNPKGKEMYGLVFYAGGKGLKSCVATSPVGESFTLKEFWKGAGNLRRHPVPADMKPQMPEVGKYVFDLTFDDGTSKKITDELEDTVIPALDEITVDYDDTKGEVSVSWEPVEGVDGYMVKLTDKDKNVKQPFFVNKTLKPSDNSFTFNKTTKAKPGWMRSIPSKGETCYVIVVGVKFEKGIKPEEKNQNKQINTMKFKKIVW